MTAYTRTQTASVIASASDYTVTFTLKHVLSFWYLSAAFSGTVCGGVINFLAGRYWVFKKGNERMKGQLIRYFFVWNGNLLLNISGVFVMTGLLHINYLFSKIFISVVVGLTYNYLLQKKYVFR